MGRFGRPQLMPQNVKTLAESHMRSLFQDKFVEWRFSSLSFSSVLNTAGIVKNSWIVAYHSETARRQNIHPDDQIVEVCDETQTVKFRRMM